MEIPDEIDYYKNPITENRSQGIGPKSNMAQKQKLESLKIKDQKPPTPQAKKKRKFFGGKLAEINKIAINATMNQS